MIRSAGVAIGGRITPFRAAHVLAGIAALVLLAFSLSQLGHGLYIKAKAQMAQVMLERAWAETLAGPDTVKPWPWADMWPVAKIEVPRLGRSAIVLAGASGEAMAFGPGLVDGTPQPGARGMAVIAAHRDTHFRFLQEMKQGDEIHITNANGATHVFRVTATAIVDADRSGIDPYGAGHHIALVTCFPFGALSSGPLRYVVFGEEV